MNTAEHWRQAENLLELAGNLYEQSVSNKDAKRATRRAAQKAANHLALRAQVHATLATYPGTRNGIV